ncbi:MAG: acyltransferase family protein [Patescibacteria group bacterium]|jgi:peptidoglycan/LPS O-acetylase OafA/YrhL
MIISISSAVQATEIFSVIFFLVLVIFVRRRQDTVGIPPSLSTELKGLAILMIVFSHIGYFLVNDHRFLWPLSSLAGVGVDLFLLLSGYGLAVSQLQKNLTIKQFYQRRLIKLFIPFWLALLVFLVLDLLVLKINYSWNYIGWSFLGIFTRADLYQDINSPLWYFTFILIYYLAFPLLFSKTRPWLSAIIMYLIGYLLIWWNPVQLVNAVHLYRVHIVAFPLGVFLAWLMPKIKNPKFLENLTRGWQSFFYYFSLAGLLGIFVYANTHSGIGFSANLEQAMSIVAVLALLGVFILKKIEFKLFYWFGVYSYEIYLLHWPLMYRYDFIYRFMPAGWEWLAVILYLILFIGLGWGMARITNLITSRPSPTSIVK